VKVGIVGSSGFVGNAVSNGFDELGEHVFLPINRGDDVTKKISEVDFVIHSANPARRFFANSNPQLDRQETVEKTLILLKASQGKPFLLVSTISCRTQLETSYGINRKQCEDIVLENGGAVVRLGPMYGSSRVQDVIHDICESRRVFASRDSRQSFSSIDWNGAYIASNFSLFTGVIEIGARNYISLGELADYAESSSEFSGQADDQFPLHFENGPDVLNVLKFIDQIKFGQMRS
jgi:nucleoside-diphosphate-sugar epimerase